MKVATSRVAAPGAVERRVAAWRREHSSHHNEHCCTNDFKASYLLAKNVFIASISIAACCNYAVVVDFALPCCLYLLCCLNYVRGCQQTAQI
jgi:hypothetical protein